MTLRTTAFTALRAAALASLLCACADLNKSMASSSQINTSPTVDSGVPNIDTINGGLAGPARVNTSPMSDAGAMPTIDQLGSKPAHDNTSPNPHGS